MRLYANMYSLVRQVQQATTHAEKYCTAVAGTAPFSLPNTEKTFPELKARIANTINYLKSFKPEQLDGKEDKLIMLHERELPAQVRLLNVTLPHFYFHCITAYDILRHCGVPLVKHDFMGKPAEL